MEAGVEVCRMLLVDEAVGIILLSGLLGAFIVDRFNMADRPAGESGGIQLDLIGGKVVRLEFTEPRKR